MVNVSQAMKDKFDTLKIVPMIKSKVVYNRIDEEKIKNKSREVINIPIHKFRIVSVCRIEDMKGISQLCEIAKKLKEQGCDYVWYFVGKGNKLDILG